MGDEEEVQALVFDNGSAMTKAGFGGNDTPGSIFPTIVGRPRHVYVGMGGGKDCFVGDEAQAKRGILNLNCPIEKGIVTNWDDMEKIIWHTYYIELRAPPEDYPLLLSENVLTPEESRKKFVQVMMETFGTPAIATQSDSSLSVLASGRLDGISVNFGHQTITSVAIYGGCAVKHTAQVMDIGGEHLLDYLMKIMIERGYSFTTTAERGIVRNIMENLCYTSMNFEEDMMTASNSSSLEKSYKLPSGQVFTVGNERFRCSETLFNPSILGMDHSGLPSLIQGSIMGLPADELISIPSASSPSSLFSLLPHEIMTTITQKLPSPLTVRKEYWHNIVLQGGPSMFPGMADRLQKELQLIAPQGVIPRVIAPPERKYSAWIGGSIVASLSSFQDQWITKEEYDETGPAIVTLKCLC